MLIGAFGFIALAAMAQDSLPEFGNERDGGPAKVLSLCTADANIFVGELVFVSPLIRRGPSKTDRQNLNRLLEFARLRWSNVLERRSESLNGSGRLVPLVAAIRRYTAAQVACVAADASRAAAAKGDRLLADQLKAMAHVEAETERLHLSDPFLSSHDRGWVPGRTIKAAPLWVQTYEEVGAALIQTKPRWVAMADGKRLLNYQPEKLAVLIHKLRAARTVYASMTKIEPISASSVAMIDFLDLALKSENYFYGLKNSSRGSRLEIQAFLEDSVRLESESMCRVGIEAGKIGLRLPLILHESEWTKRLVLRSNHEDLDTKARDWTQL